VKLTDEFKDSLLAVCETSQLRLVIVVSYKFEKVQEVFKGVFVDSDLVVLRATVIQFNCVSCYFSANYQVLCFRFEARVL
jgi:hypothetical protein